MKSLATEIKPFETGIKPFARMLYIHKRSAVKITQAEMRDSLLGKMNSYN